MKCLKSSALCALLTLCFIYSSAQGSSSHHLHLNEPNYNKPKLFKDMPNKVAINVASLDAFFNYDHGRSVNLPVNGSFNLHGVIVSKSPVTETSYKSVVIKLTGRANATFAVSKVTDGNGSHSYVGRIISHKHGDSFEIVKENGQYFLIKKDYHDLINE